MQKSLTVGIQLLAAGMMWLGQSPAQQSPAGTSTPPANQSASGQSGTAKKSTSTTTAAKKPATAATPLTLKTDFEKQSYAMGMNLGLGLHNQGMTLDPALVARGMKDAMTGSKTVLTEEEARAAVGQLQNSVREKMQAKAKDAADKFLAENKTKEGVVTTPSGLQYKILTAGNGPKPTATDTVSCNYRGTTVDGKEFDSSYKRGTPASFGVSQVIKGWTEALQMMPVGSKWQLVIPPDLAYGDRPPQGSGIAPGDVLIFEVELLSIVEKK